MRLVTDAWLPGADPGIANPLLAGRSGEDSADSPITIAGALTSLNASLHAIG
jgi:hypothetical protein